MSRQTQPRPPRPSQRERPARLQMQGGRGARSRREPQQLRVNRLWIAVAVTLLVFVLVVVRLVTLTPPNVQLHGTADTSVRVAGAAPTPSWPSSGQAAFTVPGIGSLGSSGGNTPQPTASLAKVMTAYLILKRYPLSATGDGFTLTITAAEAEAEHSDTAEDQSVVPVSAGERLTERQLLEALLIPSGDNIAQILAAHESGNISTFVAKMNSTARALGMTRTTYTDPSGFDPSTVSTASDQIKVFMHAMRFGAFRQIVALPDATLPVAGTVENFDPLMSDGYYGKTGSDSEAEGCLAFFKYLTVAGRRITEVGVVMGQGTGSDTEAILGAAGYAATNLVKSVTPQIKARTVLASGSALMKATGADGDAVHGVTDDALKVIGWGGVRERLSLARTHVANSLTQGQKIGSVALAGSLPTPRGGKTSTSIRAADKLSAPGLGWRISNIF
jgi:serine-type D-Ala-D-Ala carboxypeptidase (penicillin-binding protein 5/6)